MIDINLDLLKKDLIRDEGIRDAVYIDTLGNKTIGVGHLLPYSTDPDLVWSVDTILSVFDEDIQNALIVAKRTSAWKSLKTEAQSRALVNMAFNLGTKLFTFKTFLSFLTQKKFKEAVEDLRHTLWYRQLSERAERICQLISLE